MLTLPTVLVLCLGAAAAAAWTFRRASPPVHSTPDRPIPFGFKSTWLTVRCDDPHRVVDALRATDARFKKSKAVPCNWQSGYDRAFRGGKHLFVTPSVGGWVFALQYPLGETLDAARAQLEPLSARLDTEIFVFGSHRVASAVAWAFCDRGRLIRAYVNADTETLIDYGPPLPEERALGLLYWSELRSATQPSDEDVDRLPDETTVLRLAASLSLDPQTLGDHQQQGVGWLLS